MREILYSHFDHITILKDNICVTLQWGKVTNAIVNRQTGGECYAFLQLFFLFKNLGSFLQQ